jgi:hypothetical protein
MRNKSRCHGKAVKGVWALRFALLSVKPVSPVCVADSCTTPLIIAQFFTALIIVTRACLLLYLDVKMETTGILPVPVLVLFLNKRPVAHGCH